MPCPHCCSAKTTERSDRTAHGYRRFRCRGCGRGFNERTGSVLNRFQLPTDVVFLIVLWRVWVKNRPRGFGGGLLVRGPGVCPEGSPGRGGKNCPLPPAAPPRRRQGQAGRAR